MQLSVSGGSLYIWHLQQNVLGEQKSLEQHNIATALYYDVDNIEQKFNTSMRGVLLFMNNDTNELSDPNFIYFENTRYFSVNWIYNVFGKDIAGFGTCSMR